MDDALTPEQFAALHRIFDTGFCTDWTHFTVERYDLETLPCPLNSMAFTDTQMQTLADRVGRDLADTPYDPEHPFIENLLYDAFWESLKRNATDMGMQPYDDTLDEDTNE